MSESVLPLHKLQERLMKLKSRVSEFNNPPTLRPPVNLGSLSSHRPRTPDNLVDKSLILQQRMGRLSLTPQPQSSLGPPPLKLWHSASEIQAPNILEKENSRLRSFLRENLTEQGKIQNSLDLLRTELLARAGKISALTTDLGELKIFRDVTLPDLEASLVEKDREIHRLSQAHASHASHALKARGRPRLAIDQCELVSISVQISDNERILQDINAKLEISVSAVLSRVCRSVACGIVSTISDSGHKTQNFLCIFLKSVELFEEPDDANPKFRMQIRACTISVHTKTLGLTFADGHDAFTLAHDGKPEKLEKWLIALRGLRVQVDYN